jgi:hypothetical protein
LDMHGDGGVGIGTHDGNVFYCKIWYFYIFYQCYHI